MKLKYIYLLGLLCLLSMATLPASAQKGFENMLAYDASNASTEWNDSTKKDYQMNNTVGCCGFFHVRINGRVEGCTLPPDGEAGVRIERALKNDGSINYRVSLNDGHGFVTGRNADYNTLPVIEIERVTSGNEGCVAQGYKRVYGSGFIEILDALDSGDSGPWYCDSYDPVSANTKPAYACAKCPSSEAERKTYLTNKGTEAVVIGTGASITPGGTVIGAGLIVVGTLALTEAGSIDCSSVPIQRKTRGLAGINKAERVGLRINPNPIEQTSILTINLPQQDELTVEVFDMSGKHQQTIVMGKTMSKGRNAIPFSLPGVKSGIYLMKISTANSGIKITKRLVKK